MNEIALSIWTTLTAYLVALLSDVRVVVTLGAGVVLSADLAGCVPPAWFAACDAGWVPIWAGLGFFAAAPLAAWFGAAAAA